MSTFLPPPPHPLAHFIGQPSSDCGSNTCVSCSSMLSSFPHHPKMISTILCHAPCLCQSAVFPHLQHMRGGLGWCANNTDSDVLPFKRGKEWRGLSTATPSRSKKWRTCLDMFVNLNICLSCLSDHGTSSSLHLHLHLCLLIRRRNAPLLGESDTPLASHV
jgi:hypothetical protein